MLCMRCAVRADASLWGCPVAPSVAYAPPPRWGAVPHVLHPREGRGVEALCGQAGEAVRCSGGCSVCVGECGGVMLLLVRAAACSSHVTNLWPPRPPAALPPPQATRRASSRASRSTRRTASRSGVRRGGGGAARPPPVAGCSCSQTQHAQRHTDTNWNAPPGNDFRPDYKRLCILKQQFPAAPLLALTATATQRVSSLPDAHLPAASCALSPKCSGPCSLNRVA